MGLFYSTEKEKLEDNQWIFYVMWHFKHQATLACIDNEPHLFIIFSFGEKHVSFTS